MKNRVNYHRDYYNKKECGLIFVVVVVVAVVTLYIMINVGENRVCTRLILGGCSTTCSTTGFARTFPSMHCITIFISIMLFIVLCLIRLYRANRSV